MRRGINIGSDPAGSAPFHRVEILAQVDSTNLEAMRRAAGGERGPHWLIAERQTAGRGRSGRHWLSPEGNLAASLLFRPACPLEAMHQLSIVAGVALHDAVTSLAPEAAASFSLKWPNDLMADGAKVAGILVEGTTFGRDAVAIIGIGLNLAAAPDVPGRLVTTLSTVSGKIIAPLDALHAIAARMETRLNDWAAGAGFAAIRQAWLERSGGIGGPITLDTGAERITGTFLGLDADGALVVRDAGGRQSRFTVGDVLTTGPSASSGGDDNGR